METLRRNTDAEDAQPQHVQQHGQQCGELSSSINALSRLANGQRRLRLSNPLDDKNRDGDGGRDAPAAEAQAVPRLQVACNAAGRSQAGAGAEVRAGGGDGRSRRDLDEEPCGGVQGGPHERHAALSAPMARLKRMLRTRSNDSSAGRTTLEERPAVSSGPGRQPQGHAGALPAHAPRVLQQSPTKLESQSSMRRLAGRQAAAKGDGAARAQHARHSAGVPEEQPAVAQSGHVDFEAMVEQKMREEAAAAGNAESRCKCNTCGRRFAKDVLAKHAAVCAKAAASKRLPMDMRRKRLAGVVSDAGGPARRRGVKKSGSGRRAGGPQSTQTEQERPAAAPSASRGQAWKRQSNALRAAMRASRCAVLR